MGPFPGVPFDRTAVRTWLFLVTSASLDRLLDSVADDAGAV